MKHVMTTLTLLTLLTLLLLTRTAAANTPPSVTHLWAQQRVNSQLVDVTYSVTDAENDPLTIRLFMVDAGETTMRECASVSGDIGAGIMPGTNLRVVWDTRTNFSGQYGTDYRLRLVASDGEIPQGFVHIAPGTFMMGSPTSEPQRQSNEAQHPVTLTRGFYMSKHEVTEQWWAEVMGEEPTTSQLPKVAVSWDMAAQFCNALSLREGLTPAYTILGPNGNVTWNRTADGYRLPTEAEWEFACRAGTTTAFSNGTSCLSADSEANYNGEHPLTGCPTGTYRGERMDVGSFAANAWGLHDMHGNVFEWVWDGYRPDCQNLPGPDPHYDVGPGASRVVRGGVWSSYAQHSRSAFRNYNSPTVTNIYNGLRPVRSAF